MPGDGTEGLRRCKIVGEPFIGLPYYWVVDFSRGGTGAQGNGARLQAFRLQPLA